MIEEDGDEIFIPFAQVACCGRRGQLRPKSPAGSTRAFMCCPECGGSYGEAPTKILSVRAPWWWFITYAGKDIENRSWKNAKDLAYRGRVLIHASKWWVHGDVDDDIRAGADMWLAAQDAGRGVGKLTPAQICRTATRALGGHIVAIADVVDCVRESSSPWFVGPVGFVLANARPLITPIPFKAALGWLDVPADVLARVKVAS